MTVILRLLHLLNGVRKPCCGRVLSPLGLAVKTLSTDLRAFSGASALRQEGGGSGWRRLRAAAGWSRSKHWGGVYGRGVVYVFSADCRV